MISIPFRLEAAACPALLPDKIKSFIFIANALIAHPAKA
jgi:hypothetical protein